MIYLEWEPENIKHVIRKINISEKIINLKQA